jgi:hypothetical protein
MKRCRRCAWWCGLLAGVALVVASGTAPADEPQAAAEIATPWDHPPVEGIDQSQFVPEPLRQSVGETAIRATLKELPLIFEQQFGVSVLPEAVRLSEFGVGVDTEVELEAHTPLYLALNRVLEREDLDWYWEEEVLHITTREFTINRLEERSHFVGDLLKTLPRKRLKEILFASTGDEEYGPWREVHGVGGEVQFVKDVLLVRQTQQVQQEVNAVLAALSDQRSHVLLNADAEDLPLLHALPERRIAVDFDNVKLGEVIEQLRKLTGLPFGIDDTRLWEFGVGLDQPITFRLAESPLEVVLENLFVEDNLSFIVRHGRYFLTTREYADGVLFNVIYDVSSFLSSRSDQHELHSALLDFAGDEEYGPWLDVHGYGGTILPIADGRFIVRQTKGGHADVRVVLQKVARGLGIPGQERVPDPREMATWYYRMPAATASELLRIIPRRIVPREWNSPIDELRDPARGTIEMLAVGTDWHDEPRDIPMNPGLPIRGGGAWQVPAESPSGTLPFAGHYPFGLHGVHVEPLPPRPLAKPSPFTEYDAILIVRHRREVHDEIEAFLNQILFNDPLGHIEFGSIPQGPFPEAAVMGDEGER